METAELEGPSSLDRIVPLVYEELRAMAHRQLVSERSDLTLQRTALVSEVYLKLVDDARVTNRGRSYFFAAAAHAMREIPVDSARRRVAAKRGGGAEVTRVEGNHASVDAYAAELLDLNRAFERLAGRSPRQMLVVEHRK